MERIVVLSGAGMSADSGLKTFRDSGGLWEGYDINEVATVDGWQKNPEKVLAFYNRRRKQLYEVEPNEGHKALVRLEENFEVTIVTQNVDDLHERAGSTDVVHLHGELSKARSVQDETLVYDIKNREIKLGDTAEDGAQLRPHVVWFGELVSNLEKAAEIVMKADLLVVIGTSLMVYPAAGLINYAKAAIPRFIIDPSRPDLHDPEGWEHIEERAAEGTPKLVEELLESEKAKSEK